MRQRPARSGTLLDEAIRPAIRAVAEDAPALDVQEVGPGSREGGLRMQNEKGVIMQQRR